MAFGGARLVRADLFLIFWLWLGLIATMVVLQAAGLDFGFDLWPIGEFRNWLQFLQEGPGYNAAKLFWAVDHRNALSPWWYLAARPLIEAVPAAPLILHLLVGLFVGIAAYLLMAELTSSHSFALSVGILSSLFIPNVYRDEVIWNFVGALGCTLVCIWLFAIFCRDRRQSGYLAASYLAWFVAIATYTIQIGAMGGVFFVSLRQRLSTASWTKAVFGAALDTLPYAGLLALYVMIWLTTSPPGVPSAFRLQFSLVALAQSIGFGIWNVHYHFFWTWLTAADNRLMFVIFALLATSMLAMLRWVRPGQSDKPTLTSLGFALLVATCIAGPTIALEASSDLWIPGTRWPMLMQLWSPFLFCSVLFLGMSKVPARYWLPVWRVAIACSAAFAILLVLGFNRTQVIHVRQERAFFAELQAAVTRDRLAGAKFPRGYLIKLLEPAPFLPVAQLADPYAHTILGRDVTFRVTDRLPEQSDSTTSLVWKDQHLIRAPDELLGQTSTAPGDPR